jgi:DNA-binding MarR family transcriptional regulator
MAPRADERALRAYRNSRLYRSLTRTLRVYNRLLLERIHERGFDDFLPAFPSLLSNLDREGTRIGVLATRAGVTRQAAGQVLKEIERRGYITMAPASEDARAMVVYFTPKGRRLLATVLGRVEEIEADFESMLERGEFDRIRKGLLAIADRIDPVGALGESDRAATTRPGRGGGAQG